MVSQWPYLLAKSARPQQWIKNLALFAALVFSGFFFHDPVDGPAYFWTVFFAFLVFNILTSAIYITNDIIDRDADRLHPYKRKRPIASGALPVKVAAFAAIAGLVIAVASSFYFPPFFRLTVMGYLFLQIAYAKILKNISIIDVLSIATGFVLRIYAGAFVVNLHTNVWFLLTVISASLFLAVGKRQSERTLLEGKEMGETRKALRRYSQRLLDQYTGMFANATWLTYALFAFQRESTLTDAELPEVYLNLPRTLQSQKLLMLTVPIVIFGIMRYLQLVYEDNKGESPERVLLRDLPLLTAAMLFALFTLIILYAF